MSSTNTNSPMRVRIGVVTKSIFGMKAKRWWSIWKQNHKNVGERAKKKKKAKMADAWLDKDDFWHCSSPFVLHSKVFWDGGEKNALRLFAFHNAHPLQILYRIRGVKGVSPRTVHWEQQPLSTGSETEWSKNLLKGRMQHQFDELESFFFWALVALRSLKFSRTSFSWFQYSRVDIFSTKNDERTPSPDY